MTVIMTYNWHINMLSFRKLDMRYDFSIAWSQLSLGEESVVPEGQSGVLRCGDILDTSLCYQGKGQDLSSNALDWREFSDRTRKTL